VREPIPATPEQDRSRAETRQATRRRLDPGDALAAHLMGLAVGSALIFGLALSTAIVMKLML